MDDEIAKNEINLHNDTDPVKTMLAIVNTVAVDSPISQVTRLINTYQSVISCTRKKDEHLSLFASRFRGLASNHLRYCGASPSPQTGKVLAITLLNNARLDDIVLTNAKMQLISLAQERANKEKDKIEKMIPLSSIQPSISFAEQFKDMCAKEVSEDEDGDIVMSERAMKDMVLGLDDMHKMLVATRDEAEKEPSEEASLEEMFKDKSQVIKLHLDDAVTVLRNIAQGSQSKQTYTHTEVQAMIAAQFQPFVANHQLGSKLANAPPLGSEKRRNDSGDKGRSGSGGGKRHGDYGGQLSKKRTHDSDGGPQKRRKRLHELIPDATDHCIDCGSKTHKRGEDECKSMSSGTKKIREARKRDAEGNGDQGFRGGSNR